MKSSEEDIAVKLDSLEIAPTLQPLKLRNIQLPLALNPFFDGACKASASDAVLQQNSTHIFSMARNSKCAKCRLRRRSESSILDDICSISTSLNTDHHSPAEKALTLGRSINKNNKKASPTNRKFFLREPILRALKTCIHGQTSARRKLQSNEDKEDTEPFSSLNTSMLHPGLRGMNDFRDLIDECETLLKEDVKLSSRFNRTRTGNENSKSFTTMQMPRNINKHQAKTTLSSSINSTPTTEQNHGAAGGNNGGSVGGAVGGTSYRSSTSCSQQASNSGCDDVTIDELASYFDTFVHIPKKMSTMAEMMYI